MTTTSYGVLILNEGGQLLLAHATGRNYWDVPKGAAEPGESPKQAALREVREETGLVLDAAALVELGCFDYTRAKSLHLFLARLEGDACDLSGCRCTSFFAHRGTGQPTPEVDRYGWFDLAQVPRHAARSMTALLQRLPGFEAMGAA